MLTADKGDPGELDSQPQIRSGPSLHPAACTLVAPGATLPAGPSKPTCDRHGRGPHRGLVPVSRRGTGRSRRLAILGHLVRRSPRHYAIVALNSRNSRVDEFWISSRVTADRGYTFVMSQGVVLWPDGETSAAIRAIWDELALLGLPSMVSYSHKRHVPHVSLAVADSLPIVNVLSEIGALPSQPIPISIDAVAVVPGLHVLLTCVGGERLLTEQARAYRVVAQLDVDIWPHYCPDGWLPHITSARALTSEELPTALRTVVGHLPIAGLLTSGGVEDGTTGDHWLPPG